MVATLCVFCVRTPFASNLNVTEEPLALNEYATVGWLRDLCVPRFFLGGGIDVVHYAAKAVTQSSGDVPIICAIPADWLSMSLENAPTATFASAAGGHESLVRQMADGTVGNIV